MYTATTVHCCHVHCNFCPLLSCTLQLMSTACPVHCNFCPLCVMYIATTTVHCVTCTLQLLSNVCHVDCNSCPLRVLSTATSVPCASCTLQLLLSIVCHVQCNFCPLCVMYTATSGHCVMYTATSVPCVSCTLQLLLSIVCHVHCNFCPLCVTYTAISVPCVSRTLQLLSLVSCTLQLLSLVCHVHCSFWPLRVIKTHFCSFSLWSLWKCISVTSVCCDHGTPFITKTHICRVIKRTCFCPPIILYSFLLLLSTFVKCSFCPVIMKTYFCKTQTYKRFKRALFIRTKHFPVNSILLNLYRFGSCFRMVAAILVADFFLFLPGLWKRFWFCMLQFQQDTGRAGSAPTRYMLHAVLTASPGWIRSEGPTTWRAAGCPCCQRPPGIWWGASQRTWRQLRDLVGAGVERKASQCRLRNYSQLCVKPRRCISHEARKEECNSSLHVSVTLPITC